MYVLWNTLSFFWTAACAVALASQTRVLAGAPVGWGALEALIFFGAVFGYNAAAAARWRRVGGWLALAPAAYVAWQLPWQILLTFCVPGLIWMAYQGIPGAYAWRERPILKPVAVSFAWAWVTVVLPLDRSEWLPFLPVFAERFFFIFALALAYDLIDRKVDRRFGLETLAGHLGAGQTIWLMRYACAASAASGLLSGILGVYAWPRVSAIAASLFVAQWAIEMMLKKWGSQPWQKMAVDAMMILQFAFILLSNPV